jgi:protein involved in sex pheromone biosynthesis
MKKHIALGLVASTLFLAGCCTAHQSAKWEYRTANTITEVNQLSDQGWILVNGTGTAAGPLEFILKRHKQ